MKYNEYVASYVSSVQITEDSYKRITPSLKVTDDTTIGEIRKWITDHGPVEFMVTQLQTLGS